MSENKNYFAKIAAFAAENDEGSLTDYHCPYDRCDCYEGGERAGGGRGGGRKSGVGTPYNGLYGEG